MFAHDLCHSPIEYLRNSTRREPLGLETCRRATRGALTAQALGAAGAAALRERLPQIFNFQYSIVNSGLSGLGIRIGVIRSLNLAQPLAFGAAG